MSPLYNADRLVSKIGIINPLKHEFHYILKKMHPYLTKNTMHLHYRDLLLNTHRETLDVCCENQNDKNALWVEVGVSFLHSYILFCVRVGVNTA
jgi:hypothetical protein